MMNDLEFDQLLESALAVRGPQTAPDAMADLVMGDVRRTSQRRPWVRRLDARAWPAPRHSLGHPETVRGLRIALATMLAIVLATGALLVGRELVDRAEPLPPELRATLTTRATIPGLRPHPAPIALPDGRLVVLGDAGDGSVAGIVDLASGQTRPVPAPDRVFQATMAARLPNGSVLLVGARGEAGVARVLDPMTARLGSAIAMDRPHHGGAIAALADGRVLVSGGEISLERRGSDPSADIFDPSAGSFAPTGAMIVARAGHALTPLEDGRLLVSGGWSTEDRWLSPGTASEQTSTPVLEVEVFDPAHGTFETVATIERRVPSWRGSEGVPPVRLRDGRILIFRQDEQRCGRHGTDPIDTQIFDPATGRLSAGPRIPHAITTATALSDGRVLVTGAWTFQTCTEGDESTYIQDAWIGIHDPESGVTLESRDPRTGAATLPFDTERAYVAAAALPDGRVALISDGGLYGINGSDTVPQVVDVFE